MQRSGQIAAMVSILRGRYPEGDGDRLRRLNRLLSYAWAHNARLAGWWASQGLQPGPLASLGEFTRYPLMRKQMLQAPLEQIVSSGFALSSLHKHPTSGSTGLPVAIYRSRTEDLVLRAFRLRAHLEYGLRWSDTRATLRTALGAAFGGRPDRKDEPWMRFRVLRVVPVNHLDSDPRGVAEKLMRIRPQVLTGHADAIWRLALEVPEGVLRGLGLKYLTAGVQTVTPDMRRRISEAFGCPLYVSYGAAEFNLLASQCPRTGLFHLNEGCNYVEILKDGRQAADGEEGEVVATNLHVFSVPIIRYALDDWAIAGPPRCPCGAPVRTIREIQGRVSEFFCFSDGARVHPFQLINPLLAFIGWLREYRMVQVARDEIEVWFNLLDGAPEPSAAAAMIERAVQDQAPPHVAVRAVHMLLIPPGRRGKNQMFAALPENRPPHPPPGAILGD